MSIAAQISRIEASRNAIRTKLVALGMATGTDKLDALAEAIENLVNQGAVSVTVKEGVTYTIPAGYHNGSGTVSGVSGGGNYTLQSKTATPTKKQQSITPDSGYFGLSDVTITPIPDAYQDTSSVTAAAGDVLTGKKIVLSDGTVVIGTIPVHQKYGRALFVGNTEATIEAGYHNGESTVYIMLETKTVTPTKSQQKITPSETKVLSEVIVEAIPDKYQDTSSVTAAAGDVLDGKKIVLSDGTVVTGTMPDNGAVSGTINGLTTTSYTIPAGKHNGTGTVTLSTDIEDALSAI